MRGFILSRNERRLDPVKKETSRQSDSVIFEGMTSIDAVIKAGEAGSERKIKRILFDVGKTSSKRRELAYLKRMSAQHGFEITIVTADEIESLAIGNTHGGIIAECTEKVLPSLTEECISDNGFYLMLEGIEDPYNFGYALRSAYAAGVTGITLPPRSWMSAAGVVCRASAGASELLPCYVSDPADACDVFRCRSYRIACAGIRDSVSAFEADLSMPLFLIVGGERRGISSAVMKLADMIVRIDYGREFRGSLSAASAATVLSYEVFRQNRIAKSES